MNSNFELRISNFSLPVGAVLEMAGGPTLRQIISKFEIRISKFFSRCQCSKSVAHRNELGRTSQVAQIRIGVEKGPISEASFDCS